MNKQLPHEISVIVPIFNEQDTVAGVVEFLLSTSLFIEVICVDDGSTDRSIERLQHLGGRITIIDNQINRGKGFSLATSTLNDCLNPYLVVKRMLYWAMSRGAVHRIWPRI